MRIFAKIKILMTGLTRKNATEAKKHFKHGAMLPTSHRNENV